MVILVGNRDSISAIWNQHSIYIGLNSNPATNAVFQMMAILLSEMDKNTSGRTNTGYSPSCRTGLLSLSMPNLNLFFKLDYYQGRYGHFCEKKKVKIQLQHVLVCSTEMSERTAFCEMTFESRPSCPQGTIVTSLEHWLSFNITLKCFTIQKNPEILCFVFFLNILYTVL